MMPDFELPPQLIDLLLVTDVSGEPIGPFLKGQAVQNTQRSLAVSYRRLGRAYRAHLEGSSSTRHAGFIGSYRRFDKHYRTHLKWANSP